MAFRDALSAAEQYDYFRYVLRAHGNTFANDVSLTGVSAATKKACVHRLTLFAIEISIISK